MPITAFGLLHVFPPLTMVWSSLCFHAFGIGFKFHCASAWHQLRFPALSTGGTAWLLSHFPTILTVLTAGLEFHVIVSVYAFPRLAIGARTCY